MSRLKLLYSLLVCLFIGISLAGCAVEVMHSAAGQADGSGRTAPRVPWIIMVEDNEPLDAGPDSMGITLEFIDYNSRALTFAISNNSDYNIRYGNGYELSGNQWGYAGEADNEFYELPSGGYNTTAIQVYQIGPGEFRVKKNILIDPENPANAREYELIADFAIANTAISADVQGVELEVDMDFASASGTVISVTNGFENGRVYFDKSFWLEQKAGGAWQDVPVIASDSFLHDTHSLAPRQVLNITVYWEWLYGKLPPGEYRIGKSFLHRTADGRGMQGDLYATFVLDGSPIPATVKKADGSSWGHPLSGVATLRAEVTELLGPDDHQVSLGNIGLLVSGLTPVWDEERTGDRFYVFDNFNLPVLDSSGKHIQFADIKVGAIVDITHSGTFLTSDPAIIAGAYLIKIVE